MISTKRFTEIACGSALVLVGIVMLFTPGQGILTIVAGVTLISPYHGRRLVWWLLQLWKKAKIKLYSLKYKRVIKRKTLERQEHAEKEMPDK